MRRSNLLDLMSDEDQQAMEEKPKVLLFDGNNLAYRNLFSSVYLVPEDNNGFWMWRHMMVNSLLTALKRFKPAKVFVIFDGKGNWRYKIFKQYKANRKGARDKSSINFEKFFPVLDEFRTSMAEAFKKFYFLRIPQCEADDVIAVLVREALGDDYESIVVSTDKDMHQLMMKDNVKQYDPIKNLFVECINPKQELEVKVVTGDKGDGVPAIRPRTGVKTAEKILDMGLEAFYESIEDEEERQAARDAYDRNRKLIDLSQIPEDKKADILNTYADYQLEDIDGMALMKFFSENRLRKHLESWQNYTDYIADLD